jgi:hypothetical protein
MRSSAFKAIAAFALRAALNYAFGGRMIAKY